MKRQIILPNGEEHTAVIANTDLLSAGIIEGEGDMMSLFPGRYAFYKDAFQRFVAVNLADVQVVLGPDDINLHSDELNQL